MHDIAANDAIDAPRCPIMNPEYRRIKEGHQALASTGCSEDFCQAGRMVHTDEPRIGENRSLDSVCRDAQAFLQDFNHEGQFKNEAVFQDRLHEVLGEIRHGSKDGIASEDKSWKLLGGNWTQTYEELEFGIRRSWRNSRKCIARNHHQELKLCDLRSITTSSGMVEELLRNATLAFNNGRVEPTVFVFPPRLIDGRGAMIWNNQILGFAGYRMNDDSILGDPGNVELTTAIIELGWLPPKIRGRFDLLPLVVMAEGDKPAMMEIPPPLARLVHIDHPEYPAIGDLGLKWVAAPALTRLGFDIGGVQYTAAPFIGWFMDAEIGVRNLADTFRYNVLPDVAKAIGLTEGKLKDDLEEFEDLPEYEQLKMLSVAQSELTYATQWSYNKAGVTMTDSLTASKKWCRYDDDFRKEHGYRLPSDPYWIAPPQGSIIPVWHRGGAPNYQPKPMISKHVQDPLKAWRRDIADKGWTSNTTETLRLQQSAESLPKLFVESLEINDEPDNEGGDDVTVSSSSLFSNSSVSLPSSSQSSLSRPSLSTSSTSFLVEQKIIAIYFCSAGTIAEKLAKRLHKLVGTSASALNMVLDPSVKSLDHLKSDDITPRKVLLIFVSSIGKGEVPPNGAAFLRFRAQASFQGVSFAVFGNGDSRYSTTYNGAAKTINEHLLSLGGHSVIGKVFRGDTATEPTPYKATKSWWDALQPALEKLQYGSGMDDSSLLTCGAKGYDGDVASNDVTEELIDCVDELETLKSASIVSTTPSQNSMLVTLDIGKENYEDMNCIQILPLNHSSKVNRALDALDIDGSDTFEITGQDCVTNAEFLSKCADLEKPFKSIDWLCTDEHEVPSLMKHMFSNLSALESLEILRRSNLISHFNLDDILRSMDLLHLRTFSVASSPKQQNPTTVEPSFQAHNTVSVMLKRRPAGRFSTTFLEDHAEELAPRVNYRIVDSVAGPSIRPLISSAESDISTAPLILVATGAGFGPMRNLIKARIAVAQEQKEADPSPGPVSLYLGLHPTDVPLVKPTVQDATQAGLAEKVEIVESNDENRRVQDALIENADSLRETLNQQGARVFVCANEQAAEGIKDVFTKVMPAAFEDGKIPDWYVEENF